MAQPVVQGLAENQLFRFYALYCSILIMKMMFMSIFTGITRFKTKAFANPEDAVGMKVKVRQDDKVERVRRAHLNDLENIPIFLIISLVYVLTNPSYFLGTMLIRLFTLARLVHTFVYAIVVVPQPARAISWFIGYAITGYMAVHNLIYFLA